jgi:hypothetical protein
MEIRDLEVITGPSLTLNTNELILMPISDVQCGVEACDEDRLKRHMEWGLEHEALFVGVGDYVDMAAPSDRRRLRSLEAYDPVVNAIQEKAERDVEKFLSLVDGSQGRWIGLVQGHHYMAFPDGTTSDTRIATALSAPFLGDCAIVNIDLNDEEHGLKTTASVWFHHGQGSSSSEAGPLSQLLRAEAAWDADVYLIGHHHKKVATKKPRASGRTGSLVVENKLLACTGSFMKGYLQGSQHEGRPGGAYPEVRMLPPVTLGGVIIYMRPIAQLGTQTRKTRTRLDMDVTL